MESPAAQPDPVLAVPEVVAAEAALPEQPEEPKQAEEPKKEEEPKQEEEPKKEEEPKEEEEPKKEEAEVKKTYDPVASLTLNQKIWYNALVQRMTGLTRSQARYCTPMTVIRFLRARNWNVDNAEQLLRETLEWRAEYKPEEQRATDELKTLSSTGKIYRSRGKDLQNRPTCVMRPCNENSKNPQDHIKLLIYHIERAIEEMDEEGNGVHQLNWIIDFTGYSIFSVSMLSTAREALHVLSTIYSERLANVWMIDAPGLFSVTWKIFSPFLPEATRNKIHFVTGNQEKKAKFFSQYFELSQLETCCGGSLQFVYDVEREWKLEIEIDNCRYLAMKKMREFDEAKKQQKQQIEEVQIKAIEVDEDETETADDTASIIEDAEDKEFAAGSSSPVADDASAATAKSEKERKKEEKKKEKERKKEEKQKEKERRKEEKAAKKLLEKRQNSARRLSFYKPQAPVVAAVPEPPQLVSLQEFHAAEAAAAAAASSASAASASSPPLVRRIPVVFSAENVVNGVAVPYMYVHIPADSQ